MREGGGMRQRGLESECVRKRHGLNTESNIINMTGHGGP